METNASEGSQTKSSPPKSKKNRNIAIIVVVVVIAIVAILLAANAMIQSSPPATANIQVNYFTIDQTPAGPTTFTVTVTNEGALSGYGTVYCWVNPEVAGTGSYTNTQIVNLDPGSTTTVSIVVATPYAMTVTKSMCGASIS